MNMAKQEIRLCTVLYVYTVAGVGVGRCNGGCNGGMWAFGRLMERESVQLAD